MHTRAFGFSRYPVCCGSAESSRATLIWRHLALRLTPWWRLWEFMASEYYYELLTWPNKFSILMSQMCPVLNSCAPIHYHYNLSCSLALSLFSALVSSSPPIIRGVHVLKFYNVSSAITYSIPPDLGAPKSQLRKHAHRLCAWAGPH